MRNKWTLVIFLAVVGALAIAQQDTPPVAEPRPDTGQQQSEGSQDPSSPPPPAPEDVQQSLVARGDYLTHSVAMCVVCHSPKDDHGNPIYQQQFLGGIIPVRPSYPAMESWAEHAPALGPLVGGIGEEVVTLLQTGISPRTGKSPRPPMPPFRMSEDDARAVVAYLQSLRN